MSSSEFWQKVSHIKPTRRQAIGGFLLATAGASVSAIADRTILKKEITLPPEVLDFPEGTTDIFQRGKTFFGFEEDIPEERRDEIRRVIKQYYHTVERLTGSEPVDIRGKTQTAVLIQDGNNLPSNTHSDSGFVPGLSLDIIKLKSDADRFSIIPELAHLCWGPYFHEAGNHFNVIASVLRDATAAFLIKDVDYLKILQKYLHIEQFDHRMGSDKLAIATISGNLTPLGGVRRLQAAEVFLSILNTNQAFISNFRGEYLKLFQDSINSSKPLKVTAVIRAMEHSHPGLTKLQDRNKILTEPTIGKHVLTAPYYDDEIGIEVLGIHIFETKEDYTEQYLEGISFNSQIVAEREAPVKQEKTGNGPSYWSPEVLNQYKGQTITLKIETAFDSDRVEIKIPTSTPEKKTTL